ncbi:hypothetical protein ABZ511_03950 [Nocardia gamkensis]|uniref:hypothetical protein n=1 Tax=Nocardia gamkensis TaxID=352869 RepID=UPI0033EDEF33
MAIVQRSTSARGFAAHCNTRHDTTDPVPEHGTQARSADRQDEHASNRGASRWPQHSQRRIISVASRRAEGQSPTFPVCFGSRWYIEPRNHRADVTDQVSLS